VRRTLGKTNQAAKETPTAALAGATSCAIDSVPEGSIHFCNTGTISLADSLAASQAPANMSPIEFKPFCTLSDMLAEVPVSAVVAETSGELEAAGGETGPVPPCPGEPLATSLALAAKLRCPSGKVLQPLRNANC
jgi:hypothetical protein